MDIRGARPAPRDVGAPRISIHNDDTHMPFGARSFASGYDRSMSGPVGIPNRPSFDVPPPLPPPKFVPVPGLQPHHAEYSERLRKESYSESLSRFGGRTESTYGSLDPSWSSKPGQDDVPAFRRRDSAAIAAAKDEGYSSLSSYSSSGTRGSYDHGPGFGRVHSHYQLDSNDSYDNQQLKKLDSNRTLDNKSPPRASALSLSMQSLQEGPAGQHRAPERPMALPRLTLAARPKSGLSIESPRLADTTLHSAVSPRDTHFPQISRPHDYRSPIETMSAGDADRNSFFRAKRQNSGPLPEDLTPGESYDHELEFPMENRLSHFHLDERRHSRVNSLSYDTLPASLKRRASSPPGDESMVRHVPSHSDLLRRRDAASRGSPAPRLSVNPPHGSISSVSSGDRSGSFGGLSTATSMTSSLSFGRRSPIGLSPSGISPTELVSSPFATPTPVNLSPRSTIAPRTSAHQRAPSDARAVASPRKLTDPAIRTGSGVGKIQGFHMCDCCPKKPKKFDTYEELAAHEAEKQYECSFCGNRFKNKNEAERHQNSLHVRRHSWSCSALSTYDRAFHESTTRPGEADTCGYCGEEFARTGPPSTGHVRLITDQDWDERIRHLSDHHKFRECNSSKKFFRADHFRQHLKHSHAGTSGKWTNMLENACMMEEELPQPLPGR